MMHELIKAVRAVLVRKPKPKQATERIIRNAEGKYMVLVWWGGRWSSVGRDLQASRYYDHDWWFDIYTLTTEDEAHDRLARFRNRVDVSGVVYEA